MGFPRTSNPKNTISKGVAPSPWPGFEGQNTSLGGHDFCLYSIFKTNFSGN